MTSIHNVPSQSTDKSIVHSTTGEVNVVAIALGSSTLYDVQLLNRTRHKLLPQPKTTSKNHRWLYKRGNTTQAQTLEKVQSAGQSKSERIWTEVYTKWYRELVKHSDIGIDETTTLQDLKIGSLFLRKSTALAVVKAYIMPQQPLFFLFPVNDGAEKCIEDPTNEDVIRTQSEDSPVGIPVDLLKPSKTPGCILSFGRNGDVCISGARISGVQCQFLLNETTREIILRDCSAYQSTTLTN